MRIKPVHVTVSHSVDRIKDLDTGKYRAPVSTDEAEKETEEIELTIEGSYYYSPGRKSGPPESCYPDESESEIIKVTGPEGWDNDLTDSEEEAILEKIQIEVSENQEEADPPEYESDDFPEYELPYED